MPEKIDTQVSLDADLLDRARARNVDLSAILEDRLRMILPNERAAAWQIANVGAIEDANRFLIRQGLWSDGKRQF